MRAWLSVLLIAFASACSAAGPRNGHPVVPIKFGQHVLQAEVVSDGDDRAKGLMFRREMGELPEALRDEVRAAVREFLDL